MKRLLFALSLCFATFAYAETELAAPTRQFTDFANVVSSEVALDTEVRLNQLKESDSTEFVVYIAPTLDTESSLEDYTQRTAQRWGVGSKEKNNGLILFLFAKDTEGYKRIRFETGYGLEGAFPDAKAKLIIERVIVPLLKEGKWDEAVQQGVDAAIKEIKGEYVAPKSEGAGFFIKLAIFAAILWLICLCIWPRKTLHFTAEIGDALLTSSKSSGGSGGYSGGGGSFGGGGASGRA